MELSKKVIDTISNALKIQAQKQGVELKTSTKNNVFGARIKSKRGTVEVDVIFDDDTAFIHLSGGLFSPMRGYHYNCLSLEEFQEEFIKIENYINDCFKLKLVKK